MRILWVSNAPWVKSGYGTQTSQVVRRLAADGHEVAILANAGIDGRRINWEGVMVLPPGQSQYGNEILSDHYDWWMRGQPGWAITLYDAWVFDRAMLHDGVRIASWVPVDHDPAPAGVAQWCADHFTITMSRFGQDKLAELGIQSRYIPHALEPDFRPTDALPDGRTVREVMQVPDDAFLVVINAANQGTALIDRKSWGEMFIAFGEFARRHDDAYLYVHAATVTSSGIPLKFAAQACGIPPERVRWANQPSYKSGDYETDQMAALYTAGDVLLATSRGEGFGIPVIEAQACGTPVIVSDWTAQPELVGAGWKVPVQPQLDPHQMAFWGVPIVGEIVNALEEAYQRRGDPELRTQALVKAAEYDADKVYDEAWRPVIAELDGLLSVPKEPAGINRQQRRAARRQKVPA
jgi:glycosyltransferase involved in cell wall biosynthesis